MAVIYRGTNRAGVAIGGSTPDEPAALLERLFDAGARWAIAEVDGAVVGEITTHPDTGKRTWWAEA